VVIDSSGQIRLVNAQTETMFGYPRQQLLGRDAGILVPERFRHHHALYREAYAADVRMRLAGQELYGLRRDGVEFPVEISLSRVRTAEGLLISAAVRDVSNRKSAEQRIRELARLVESSQDAVLTKTPDGTITYWNAAATRLYGYEATEAIGKHVSMLAPPDRVQEIDTLLARLRRGERIDNFATVRRTKSGVLLDVDILIWPILDRDGTVVSACTISRDITERRRAEAEAARRYEQQKHVALTLQKALMGTVGEVPGVQSASRYLPATQGEGVGGDWFDVIPLGAGRIGVLIGDVMGRGLEAAIVMGQLRSAANALARTGMAPARLMNAMELVARDIPDQLTTCCYLVIDPHAGEVTGSSAGHLPVLLVNPDAAVRQLPIRVSAPLGLGDIPHEQTTVPVTAGATLVLYTDGLVERRKCDIDQRIAFLADETHVVFSRGPCSGEPDLEKAADQILASLRPGTGEPPDDVTLLLVRIPAAPLFSITSTWPAEPASVGVARDYVSDTLTRWRQQHQIHIACLLVSEIVTNAVRHAHAPVEMRLYLTARQIIAEITDDSAGLPQRRLPDTDDENGRGLILVDGLSDSWGARPTDTGKTVWFTLAADPVDETSATPAACSHRVVSSLSRAR
jgi:PAS domain S-box-containing protein